MAPLCKGCQNNSTNNINPQDSQVSQALLESRFGRTVGINNHNHHHNHTQPQPTPIVTQVSVYSLALIWLVEAWVVELRSTEPHCCCGAPHWCCGAPYVARPRRDPRDPRPAGAPSCFWPNLRLVRLESTSSWSSKKHTHPARPWNTHIIVFVWCFDSMVWYVFFPEWKWMMCWSICEVDSIQEGWWVKRAICDDQIDCSYPRIPNKKSILSGLS